ncbi:hypothetical protein [Prosthecobacter fluviatilis]|uniref:Uncharacterized protein n=1 Tax=Prosthecobacter fluviatilis TaxID=445931 RepID=A0ABW0KUF8_9BACT
MNSLFNRPLLMICALSFAAQLKAETLVHSSEENWEARLAEMPPQVQTLVRKIQSMDMHPYLLSELKNNRLLISHFLILEDSLVAMDFDEGHTKEKVLFDFDVARGWTIIRRSPQGDWKPKGQRNGDRLTPIPFPVEASASEPITKKP